MSLREFHEQSNRSKGFHSNKKVEKHCYSALLCLATENTPSVAVTITCVLSERQYIVVCTRLRLAQNTVAVIDCQSFAFVQCSCDSLMFLLTVR